MRFPFVLRIRTLVVLLCGAVALVSGVVLAFVTANVTRDVTERESTVVLRTLGQQAANQFARALYTQWRELEGLVRFAEEMQGPADLRVRLDTVARLNDRYAWVGFVRPDGRVAVASGGLLEGESVAQRPWFRAALQGPFGGDVHDAVLLQRLVAPNATEPLRLIDFAAPVRARDGSLLGVLGSHVSWRAIREVLRDVLGDTGRDVLLVNRAGTILAGPPDVEGRNLELPSILAARQGAARNSVETWPDGETYLAAVITPVKHRNLPNFGWSIIVREKADAAAAPARAIVRQIAVGLGASALIVLAGSFLLGGLLERPLRRLGKSAAALAEDRLTGPVPDLRTYAEVGLVADSLARLQARLAALREAPPVLPPQGARRPTELERRPAELERIP
jgi:HAMP domain-containing protein